MRQAGFECHFAATTAPSVGGEGRLGRGGAPEFQQVVGQADELPFGLHLGDAPQDELAETACLFDLTAVFIRRETGRLDWSLSLLVRLRCWYVSRPVLVRRVRARHGFGVSDRGMRPGGTGGSAS